MNSIQITIPKLKAIIEKAEQAINNDNSLSKTLVIDLISESDTFNGSDCVSVAIKSAYQECNGIVLH